MDNRMTKKEWQQYNSIFAQKNKLDMVETVSLGLIISAIVLFTCFMIFFRPVG